MEALSFSSDTAEVHQEDPADTARNHAVQSRFDADRIDRRPGRHAGSHRAGVSSGRLLYRFQPPGTRRGACNSCRMESWPCRMLEMSTCCRPDSAEPRLTLGGHKGQINAMTASRDGRRLLTASHDGMIRVWDIATGAARDDIRLEDWPGDGRRLLTRRTHLRRRGREGQIVVWDVTNNLTTAFPVPSPARG